MKVSINKPGTTYNYQSEENGCWYENCAEEFWTSTLDFCGCGNSQHFIKKCYEYLKFVKSYHDDPAIVGADNIIYSDDLFYLIAYICDLKELTEHGYSIGGAWLTDLGKKWLVKLEEFYRDEN